jgi:hypothetical protein
MLRTLVLFALAVLPLGLLAQKEWQGGLFQGLSNYQGDFVVEDYAFLKHSNLSVGLQLRKGLSPNFGLRGGVTLVNLSGADDNYPERAVRGFSFKNTMFEVMAGVEWEPFGHNRYRSSISRRHILSPYLFTGVALVLMDPQPNLNYTGGPDEDPRVLEDLSANLKNILFTLPVGIGVSYDLDDHWVLAVEGGLRPTFSDYVDGLSQAGNPEKNDWYQVIGLRVNYRIY